MYQRILLPTDGSSAMGSTIEQCLYQAEQSDATVHALYVVDIRSYMMLPEETGNRVADLLREDGQQALETVRKQAAERQIDVVTELAVGVPATIIVQYANAHGIDLIVMGTKGRTGDGDRQVGSVAEEVVRNADIPVLAVQMSEVEQQEVSDEVPEEQDRYIQ